MRGWAYFRVRMDLTDIPFDGMLNVGRMTMGRKIVGVGVVLGGRQLEDGKPRMGGK